ncbi:hypothetical protein BDR26DRAFT_849381 [Obelidium mucronatum]|nr:hypothetical protein BDR26DRAFT_849381 [Obelidium mucronatum]
MLHPLLAFIVVVVALQPVSAFTNGTLIPPYLCDLKDMMKGGPKSLGDIIPLLKEDDAQEKIAGYHKLTSKINGGYPAQKLCTAEFVNGFQAEGNRVVVKTTTMLTEGGKQVPDELVGLIVWIQDFPPSLKGFPRRIGEFTSAGKNMMHYPYRCGQTLVHTDALNDEAAIKSQSDDMIWNAPECGVFGEMVEVRGVCVTEKGFGTFSKQIPTGGIRAAEKLAGCSENRKLLGKGKEGGKEEAHGSASDEGPKPMDGESHHIEEAQENTHGKMGSAEHSLANSTTSDGTVKETQPLPLPGSIGIKASNGLVSQASLIAFIIASILAI